ncbi:acyl-CoA thioesterase [Tenuibacillus multivorans]|uniref:Acyl-CoA thioester hydrolase n=1 Tax=Tenuibacillus multivorans TaxID=237069 RepID=A0A1H0CIE0_9BACI|nr:thioesterase family protein [Tenuibacillus multivorans]GEL76283.1 putative acyl-CoA thioesterase YneP [Tenuibacillus multivorans]SDN57668.1 acyl-CoA thioester hydrolase [Tenuibacillus multivorans]
MTINETEVKVRYQETDQMGVVYHANYIVWFEIGRTHLIEQLGFNYADMEAEGIVSPVIDINAKYKKPLRYGQTATVRTWIDHYDGFRVVYGYEVYTEDEQLAVTGSSSHVCVKKSNFRPISIKKHFPNWDEAYIKAMED